MHNDERQGTGTDCWEGILFSEQQIPRFFLGGQRQNRARKISKLSVVLANHTSNSCLALSPWLVSRKKKAISISCHLLLVAISIHYPLDDRSLIPPIKIPYLSPLKTPLATHRRKKGPLTLGNHSLAFECINSIRSLVRVFPNIFVKRWIDLIAVISIVRTGLWYPLY